MDVAGTDIYRALEGLRVRLVRRWRLRLLVLAAGMLLCALCLPGMAAAGGMLAWSGWYIAGAAGLALAGVPVFMRLRPRPDIKTAALLAETEAGLQGRGLMIISLADSARARDRITGAFIADTGRFCAAVRGIRPPLLPVWSRLLLLPLAVFGAQMLIISFQAAAEIQAPPRGGLLVPAEGAPTAERDAGTGEDGLSPLDEVARQERERLAQELAAWLQKSKDKSADTSGAGRGESAGAAVGGTQLVGVKVVYAPETGDSPGVAADAAQWEKGVGIPAEYAATVRAYFNLLSARAEEDKGSTPGGGQ